MIKAIVSMLLLGKETKKGVVIIVLSVVAGFLALMFLPIAVLSALGDVEAPEIDYEFDKYEWMNSMSIEQQTKLNNMETIGLEIQKAMETAGVREQTIKAQLIYISCLENAGVSDYNAYAELFANATDDTTLIDSINSTYGVEIAYEEYMRSYVAVMNSTINAYMFSDVTTKNATDLSAWAENAYISGWGYEPEMKGEMNLVLRHRTADNQGLIKGYLQYNPADKVFEEEPSEVKFTEHGSIDNMPEVKDVGVYDGTNIAVYVGGGEVIYSSADRGCVVKEQIESGEWIAWCTFDDLIYPQEVQDAINQTNISNTETKTRR